MKQILRKNFNSIAKLHENLKLDIIFSKTYMRYLVSYYKRSEKNCLTLSYPYSHFVA